MAAGLPVASVNRHTASIFIPSTRPGNRASAFSRLRGRPRPGLAHRAARPGDRAEAHLVEGRRGRGPRPRSSWASAAAESRAARGVPGSTCRNHADVGVLLASRPTTWSKSLPPGDFREPAGGVGQRAHPSQRHVRAARPPRRRRRSRPGQPVSRPRPATTGPGTGWRAAKRRGPTTTAPEACRPPARTPSRSARRAARRGRGCPHHHLGGRLRSHST